MSTASSSTSSERDERVFIAAFGMMDSHQDGEAVAAFMRVRTNWAFCLPSSVLATADLRQRRHPSAPAGH